MRRYVTLMSVVASVLLLLGPVQASADCTKELGPRSGVFSTVPGPNESLLVVDPNNGDVERPSAASLSNVETLLVWSPGLDRAGCPEMDRLVFRVDGGDDRTPPERLYLAAFLAETEVDIWLQTVPTYFFRFDPQGASTRTVTITLGEADGRLRDGRPFRSRGPFCFSIALMDEAGQVGTRSNAFCLQTTDGRDPSVRFVDSESKGCSATALSGVTCWALLTLFALGRRRNPRSS